MSNDWASEPASEPPLEAGSAVDVASVLPTRLADGRGVRHQAAKEDRQTQHCVCGRAYRRCAMLGRRAQLYVNRGSHVCNRPRSVECDRWGSCTGRAQLKHELGCHQAGDV